MSEAAISVLGSGELLAVLGTCDQHARRLREALGVNIAARDDRIHIQGNSPAVARATEVLEQLRDHAQRYGTLAEDDVTRILDSVIHDRGAEEASPIRVFNAARQIHPRTTGQAAYVTAIRNHSLIFCAGPAGTGKTYLAVAMAVAALKEAAVTKVVLVRPAVEAGESLGYLPGDLQAKINPYLRPLFDALGEMMDHDQVKSYTEEDRIEVVPLAYMRGRTLNEAFVILDEAQNTTVSQMKMFLTRMGMGSKIVVSGDTTQIDLPPQNRSGLIDALARLRKIKGIATVKLTKADIVRHPLVQRIVDAYDRGPKKKGHR